MKGEIVVKILVLSLSTGGGHHSVCKALVKYITAHNHDVKMVDAYEYIAPKLSAAVSKGYLVSTKYVPNTYSKFYRFFENHNITDKKFALIHGMNRIMSMKFESCVKEYAPDVIVCSHVLAVALLENMDDSFLEGIKIIGIVTDYTVHPMWEDSYIDYYVLGSELLGLQMAKKKLPGLKNYKLGTVVDKLGIVLDNAHRAINDTTATAKVFIKLM